MMNNVNGCGIEKIYHFSFTKIINFQWGRFITGIWSLSPLLFVKIVHLVVRSDLLKISNLVYDGKKIIRSLYSSLQGQTDRQTVYGGYSELAGSSFVSVKFNGLGNVLEQLTL
jgi:hypothetical protein